MKEYKVTIVKNDVQDEYNISAHNDGQALTEIGFIVESKDFDELYCFNGNEVIFNYSRPREFSYLVIHNDKINHSDTMIASSIYRARLLVRQELAEYPTGSYAVITFDNERSIVEW